MCIRDRLIRDQEERLDALTRWLMGSATTPGDTKVLRDAGAVSYTHLRAHETVLDLVCRLLLEKKTTTTIDTV